MDIIKNCNRRHRHHPTQSFGEARGYFFESFSQRDFEEVVRKINFVQDNDSMLTDGFM